MENLIELFSDGKNFTEDMVVRIELVIETCDKLAISMPKETGEFNGLKHHKQFSMLWQDLYYLLGIKEEFYFREDSDWLSRRFDIIESDAIAAFRELLPCCSVNKSDYYLLPDKRVMRIAWEPGYVMVYRDLDVASRDILENLRIERGEKGALDKFMDELANQKK